MRIKLNPIDLRFKLADTVFQIERIVLDSIEEPIPFHSHGNGCFELHYIASGSGTVLIDTVSHSVKSGTFFITGPHVRHSQTSTPGNFMQEYCLYLKVLPDAPSHTASASDIEQCVHLFSHTPFWCQDSASRLGNLIASVFEEIQTRDLSYLILIEAKLKELIIMLARNYILTPNKISIPERMETSSNVFIIMDEYFLYSYQHASLEELAGQLSLSKRQTERLLHQYYGKTFQQKKTDARMAVAILLLSQPHTITQIADELGYSSIEHFSSSFKHYYNVSPSEYRRGLLEK